MSFTILLGFLSVMCSFPVFSQDNSMWMNKGDALWEERGDVRKVEEAINAYSRVLETDPENYEANWKIARAYFLLGDMLDEIRENRKQYKEV